MKTTKSRKLSLSRETLRHLDSADLRRAGGGATSTCLGVRNPTDVTITCPSVDICPSLDDVAWKCKPPIVA